MRKDKKNTVSAKAMDSNVLFCSFVPDYPALPGIDSYSPLFVSTSDVLNSNQAIQRYWNPPVYRRKHPFVVNAPEYLARDKKSPVLVYKNGFKSVLDTENAFVKTLPFTDTMALCSKFKAVETVKATAAPTMKASNNETGKADLQGYCRQLINSGKTRAEVLPLMEAKLRIARASRSEEWRKNMAKAIYKRVTDIDNGKYVPSKSASAPASTSTKGIEIDSKHVLAVFNSPLSSAEELGIPMAEYTAILRVLGALADNGTIELNL